MTIRNVDQNLVQMIRDLQEEVRLLKSNVGSTRLNSIRLGNWVLEAVDDSLVKMTNITTGEESYIGGVGGGEGSSGDTYILHEFPPLSIGGVLVSAFGATVKTNLYIVPYAQEITKVVTTLAVVGTGSTHPRYRIYCNGEIIFTSSAVSTNYSTVDFSYSFNEDDVVYMDLEPTTGNGTAIGLSVFLRR